jgi:hypothetical protein
MDFGLHQWHVSHEALEAQIAAGGPGYEPFHSLIPGGAEGPFYRQMEDMFYYAQLRR